MRGMNAQTGGWLSSDAHLRQSIENILTTPIGTRVMLRDFGSDLFSLVDRPINNELKLAVASSVFAALKKWEPRIRAKKVTVLFENKEAALSIDIEAIILSDNREIKLQGIKIS